MSRNGEKPCVTTKMTLNSTILTGYIEELKITLQLSSQHDKKYFKVTICLVQLLLVKYRFNKTSITEGILQGALTQPLRCTQNIPEEVRCLEGEVPE